MPKFYKYPFAGSGDRTTIDDVNPGSGMVNYQSGWTTDYQKNIVTDPTARPIPRGQTNQFYYDVTDNIQQYQTHGVPEFITLADNGGVTPYSYDKYARVRYDDGVNGFQLYESRIDANTDLPSVATSWRIISGDAGGIPTGAFMDFGMATAPSGYLVCDGSEVAQASYPALYAAIGHTWDGPIPPAAGNFRLPPARRFRLGSGGVASGIIGNTVGSIGGAETHQIQITEMPSHNHPGSVVYKDNIGSVGGAQSIAVNQGQSQYFPLPAIAVAAQGGNQAMTIMPPGIVALMCIKF